MARGGPLPFREFPTTGISISLLVLFASTLVLGGGGAADTMPPTKPIFAAVAGGRNFPSAAFSSAASAAFSSPFAVRSGIVNPRHRRASASSSSSPPLLARRRRLPPFSSEGNGGARRFTAIAASRPLLFSASAAASSAKYSTAASAAASSTSSPSHAGSGSGSASSQQRKNGGGAGGTSKNTGGLRRLPVVKAPEELADRARNVARRVKPDMKVKNVKNRARKHGAETLNALSQALCLPLRDVVAGYKSEWRRLHPFERVVADLTARARQKRDGLTLNQVLDEIHEARKMILEASKDWIYKVKSSETAREAGDSMNDGIEALLDLFKEFAAPPVSDVLSLQRALRSAPIVQLDAPAVVLVGSPNVGKSSIVRAISSAQPEVNNYPFTTRGMTLGHVEVFWSSAAAATPSSGEDASLEDDERNSNASPTGPAVIAKAVIPGERRKPGSLSPEVVAERYAFSQLCQVMDSPGLLVRPDEERNEMEALTLAAMQHLPTAVMYVMDLSGEAGEKCSSIEDQLQLRREVRARFPRRPWIDVISKVDLGVSETAIEELEENVLDGAPYILLSIQEGVGVDELKKEVLRMLGEVRVVLDAMSVVNN